MVGETTKHFDAMMWRDGCNSGSAQLKLLRDFYREWCVRSELALHAAVATKYLDVSTLLIAPVCPHFADKAKARAQVLGRVRRRRGMRSLHVVSPLRLCLGLGGWRMEQGAQTVAGG